MFKNDGEFSPAVYSNSIYFQRVVTHLRAVRKSTCYLILQVYHAVLNHHHLHTIVKLVGGESIQMGSQ